MNDAQDETPLLGCLNHLLRLSRSHGHGLLDKNVLACGEVVKRELMVGHGGRANRYSVDQIKPRDLGCTLSDRPVWDPKSSLCPCDVGVIPVDHAHYLDALRPLEPGKVPVRSHPSGADDSNAERGHERSP